MSSRSSTGVIVALIVFVVLSVALLAISIILYAQMDAAEKKEKEARSELNAVITTGELGRSDVQAMRGNAGSRSLFGYLAEQSGEVNRFVVGDTGAGIAKMRAELRVGENETVKDAMRKLASERDARAQEANSLRTRAADLDKELQALKTKLADAEKARAEALAKVTASIDEYKQAADGYRGEFDAAKAALEQSRADMAARFASETTALQNEVEALKSQRNTLDGRVTELKRKVEATSMKASNPAAMVDARVVDVDTKTGTLFIDIGANKRVIPGMTFEVFDDAGGIAAAADSGSRGKASVQVLKVGETTSTCRVLRGSGSRPIVRDDVLANAVFSPDYKFKFLVHGNFDVNGDGRASAAEGDYIKSRIREWGGEVVEGSSIAGDLDFVVLGAQPPNPIAPPSDATEQQVRDYTERQEARALYDGLFNTAREAEIPILNWARFEALTGTVNR